MYYIPDMSEEEWEMCGGNISIDPETLQIKTTAVMTQDRNCPSCRVGWRATTDGEACWSCGIHGDIGVAK